MLTPPKRQNLAMISKSECSQNTREIWLKVLGSTIGWVDDIRERGGAWPAVPNNAKATHLGLWAKIPDVDHVSSFVARF